jgi:hypothetical protein
MTFGCNSCGQAQTLLYGEGGGFPPNSGHGESCESMYIRGLFVYQKCSNYALTNLLFGLLDSHE